MIIEVTSPATRRTDLGIKRHEYWQCQVPYYVIVDELPGRGLRQLRILGYRHGKRGYQRMALNEQRRLFLEPVKLWLGHESGRVVCYDQQGQPIPDHVQSEQERRRVEQRAEAEALARRQAEAEVARLHQELRRFADRIENERTLAHG